MDEQHTKRGTPEGHGYQFRLRSLCLLLAVLGPKPLSAAEVTADEVFDAWRKWQDRLTTVKMEWANLMTIPKEFYVLLDERGGGKLQRPLPEFDTRLGGFCTFILDDNQWRLEAELPIVNHEKNGLLMHKITCVAKAGISRSYEPSGAVDHALVGNIMKVRFNKVPNTPTLMPPFVVFRALKFGVVDPKNYTISPGTEDIEGRPHVVLKQKHSPDRSFYFDPARGFLMTRYTLWQADKELLRTDITYTQTGEQGWVPSGWRIKSENFPQSTTAVVKNAAVNIAIDPKAFELKFPPGTLVQEWDRKTESGGTFTYVVGDDGSEQPVKREKPESKE